jgi:isopentenyl phosphate kinase
MDFNLNELVERMENLLVKLGGSLITDKSKPFTPRMDVIERLAEEIHFARKNKDIKLIISHGGGSFPHIPAKKYQIHKGLMGTESYIGLAKVQDAAARLNRIVVHELIQAGENAFSINLSSCCIADSGRIEYMYLEPLKMLLTCNMLPVPYGDVSLDRKIGCSVISTEEILRYLANELKDTEFKPKRILICGEVAGVFAGNPKEDKDAKFIPEITSQNIGEIESHLSGSSGVDVTGGMALKVKKMFEIAKFGVDSEIINGAKPGVLKRALLGETGIGTIVKI